MTKNRAIRGSKGQCRVIEGKLTLEIVDCSPDKEVGIDFSDKQKDYGDEKA